MQDERESGCSLVSPMSRIKNDGSMFKEEQPALIALSVRAGVSTPTSADLAANQLDRTRC